MRVAIVAESFLPAVNGVTNSVLRIVEQMERLGHHCTVIAPGPGTASVGSTPVIRVRSFDLPRYRDLRVGLPTAHMARLLRRVKPDVVHLAAPTMLGAAAAVSARRLGLPTVAVYQTDIAGFARRHRLGFTLERPLWRWTAWVHSHADLTLAPSTSALWKLRSHGIDDVALWARGVDLDRFDPRHRSPTLRRELAPNGEPIVGYVGRLAKEKQIGWLAALDALPGLRIVVVGDGPERARLQRDLPRAHFTGLCQGSRLSEMYASLDIFVHTGLDETFCQSVQEALASGVPVVAPASGGPLDLVRHGVNGFLWTPGASDSLVGAVDELARSPLLCARLGAAARRSVVHRPWSTLTHELLEHYRAVIDARTPRRSRWVA